MTVRTRHDITAVALRRRRFITTDGQGIFLLPDLISSVLRTRVVDWATRFTFSEVASLLEEFCGSPLLSEDTVWRLCQAEAERQDEEQAQVIEATQKRSEEALPSPCFVAVSDIYDGQQEEFLTLTDAICVSSQKPTRQKAGQEKQSKEAKRHDTDVFVLPRQCESCFGNFARDGGEQFFCEGISEKWSCVAAVSAFMRREWSGKQLKVVAIKYPFKLMLK